MYLPLLLTVLTSTGIAVEAHLANGQRLQGELQRLGDGTVELSKADGDLLRLSFQEVKQLEFANPEPDDPPKSGSFIQLVDGSRLSFQSIELDDEKARITSAGTSARWECDPHVVRAIRWRMPGEKEDPRWNEILAKDETDDLLVIRETMDYLKGVAHEVTPDTILFEYAGDTIPAPLAKVAGLALFRKEGDLPSPRLRLTTSAGSRWLLESASLDRGELSITSVAGASRRLAIDQVQSIVFPELNAVFITDLEPTSVQFTPYFGSSRIGESIALLRHPRFDRSFDKDRLIRLRDSTSPSGWRQYSRGVAIHSRTELIYRLAGKYRGFQATVGMDPAAPPRASVQLVITADDEPRYVQEIRRGDEPRAVKLDMTGVRRLRILVDFGGNLDTGDRLHLAEARLTK